MELERHLVVLAFCAAATSLVCAGVSALESVPELEGIMYKEMHGSACVRLLTVYGESGCANPGRDIAVAPIRRLSTLEIDSEHPITVLLPSSMFHTFLEKTALEPSFADKVAGVLVEFDHANTTVRSPDKMFPQAEFAPYHRKDYQWNPSGSGILHKRYSFPVYLLSEEDTDVVRKAAAENEARNAEYPVNVAEFNIIMQTTKVGSHTSELCLKESSCLPLGGYSVLSAVPPISVSSTIPSKPILLIMASMDSASFFRDLTPGADFPISGLIALLAAVDALSKAGWGSNMGKQLVFSAFTGEAWGYLGSRRFLYELENHSIAGLNASLIHQILEVGSVGHLVDNAFYAHSQEQTTPAVQDIIDALKSSAQGLGINVAMADKQNPGIPPSSLMSFLNKKPSFSGVVLEDFDTAFTNNAFHSHLDDADNVRVQSITAASTILARTIHQLANENSSTSPSIEADGGLVKELVDCLLTSAPGMECNLVKSLMKPSRPVANHYVGVFLGTPSGPPPAESIDDTSQFVWNFLADRTGVRADTHPSTDVLTTRYVPAYSTRLRLSSEGTWELLPVENDDTMDAVDPVWTESFWGSLSVRVYVRDDPFLDRLIFLLGCSITMGSAVAIVVTKAVFRKRLKRA